MKKTVSLFLALAMALILCVSLTGCTELELETTDSEKQQTVQQTLSYNQATPTDMAYNTYVKIEDTILPLPDSFELSYSNKEAESSGETEAGTVQRDIVRSGVVSIDAAYSLSRKYLPVLSTYSKMPRLKVSYFDPDLMELKETSMYMENYKVKLVKDTSYQSLWEVSFTLKEY